MHTQILDKVCSQHKKSSKSLLIIENVLFPGKRNNSNFTETKLHKIGRKPIMYMINVWL
jgi:hypothetical protein